MRALQQIDVFHSEMKKNSKRIALCTTFSEIKNTVEKGKISAVLSIEGGEPLMGDLRILRTFYRLGVRSLGLTWFPRNRLADGSWEMSSKSGLTTFGAEVVEEMNKLGMIVDVSHINEPGFWNVMEVSKSPIIASHSNCKALCDHHRNLTDDQIRAIAEKKGVMGITYVDAFLDKQPEKVSIERVLDHIEHAVKLVGAEHVGLGSDYSGLRLGMKGLEDMTKVPDITKGLVSRGYSESDIENILGGSFLKVYKNVLTK
jgi:membrane dipeptidase